MDHLQIDKFLVMGFCIGGPFIWNLLQRAHGRIVAAVLAQPSCLCPQAPDLFYQNNINDCGPALCARRSDITMPMVDALLARCTAPMPTSSTP
jgi:dienelactone hydrolase